jgi:hypothetical protein
MLQLIPDIDSDPTLYARVSLSVFSMLFLFSYFFYVYKYTNYLFIRFLFFFFLDLFLVFILNYILLCAEKKII